MNNLQCINEKHQLPWDYTKHSWGLNIFPWFQLPSLEQEIGLNLPIPYKHLHMYVGIDTPYTYVLPDTDKHQFL